MVFGSDWHKSASCLCPFRWTKNCADQADPFFPRLGLFGFFRVHMLWYMYYGRCKK